MKTVFLPEFLQPPSHADEDLQRRAKVLYYLSISLGLGALIGFFASLLFFEEKLITSLSSVILLGIALVIFSLSKTNHVNAASHILLTAVWLLTTGIVSVSGGMRSLDLLFYVSGTVVAGLLRGKRGTYLYGGATIVVGAVFLFLESQNIVLPNLFPFPARSGWLLLIINMVMLIPAVNITIGTLSESIAQAHQRLKAQQQAQAELRASEEKFSKIFHASPMAILIQRASDRHYIDVNDGFTRITGYSRAEALEKTPGELNVYPDRERLHEMREQFLSQGYIRDFEILFRRKNGEIGHALVWAEPIEIGGEAAFISGTIDITGRRKSEEALRESESRFRIFVEKTTDGIMFFNDQGRVLEWNNACEQITGLTKDQVLDKEFWDIQFQITPDEEKQVWNAEKIKQNIQQVFETGYLSVENQSTKEANIQNVNGARLVVEQRLFPIHTEHGFALGAVLRDITERKQAEVKIQQRLNELALVNAVSQVAASQLEMNEIIRATGEKLQQFPNVDCLFIALYDAQAKMISFPYYRFFEDTIEAAPIPLGQGLSSWVIQNRKPLIINQNTDQISAEKGVVRNHAPGKKHRPAKSWLGLPMQVGDQIIGVLGVQNFEREQAFSEDDVRLWETVAANVGVAIQNAQLYTAAQQEIAERKRAEEKTLHRLNELALVNAVSQVATSQLELNEMIQATGDKLRRIPNADCISIALYEAHSQTIRFPYFRYFEEMVQVEPVPLGAGLNSTVIASRKALVINQDLEAVSASLGYIPPNTPGKKDPPAKSWLGVPLQVGDQIIGVIAVQNFERELAFTAEDVRLWETIAANVGVAIQNAQLYTAAQQEIIERKNMELALTRQTEEITTLYEALAKITGSPENVKSISRQIADVIVKNFQTYECGVWLLTEDRLQVIRKAYSGPGIIDDEDFIPMTNVGLITTAIKTGESIYAPDVRNDPRYFVGDELTEPTLSEFVVPLRAHGEVLGVINAESPNLDDFSERIRRLIMAFAENAALAVQNAKLVASLEKNLAELKESNDRINFFLEHTAEGVYRIDYDPPIPIDLPFEEQYKLSRQRGRFGECNLAIARMYGYSSREEMLAAPYYVENDGYESSLKANVEFYRRGYRSEDQETEEYTATGEKAYFLNNAVGIVRDGYYLSLWGTQRNITPLKKALTELEQLNAELEERVEARTAELRAVNKELETFSYSVSHDLRAPLRAIRGFSEIVVNDFSGQLDPVAKNFLDKVVTGATEMSDKIDGLLRFSRLSRSELHWQALDLSALADEVLAVLRAGDPGRAITCTVAPNLTARGDLVLIRNVLENLLGNAWKYSSKNPQAQIEFGQTEKNGQRAFFVKDNGAGFSMQYADKLFGTFQRLHRADEFEGHGIGLATVQRIIHRHGGRIWAEAEEGKGATFYFTLGGNM